MGLAAAGGLSAASRCYELNNRASDLFLHLTYGNRNRTFGPGSSNAPVSRSTASARS